MVPAALQNFSSDHLNREGIADYLTHFITTSSPTTNEKSLVIAIDSPWGTGKTSFINMWSNKLRKEENTPFNIIQYNAWENDDAPNALIPIICSFSQLLSEDPNVPDNRKTNILQTIKIVASHMANGIIDRYCGIDFCEISRAVSEATTTSLLETIYDDFTALEEKKETFRDLVKQFTDDGKKLLIYIDELDRCRPTFAIETLEAVKHFFDLENVIFVFSLDLKQLQHSIATIYGNIDSIGYLQRFFDYITSFPTTSLNQFVSERLLDQHGILLNDEYDIMMKLTKRFSLSLRMINVICEAYRAFYLKKFSNVPHEALSIYTKFRERYLTFFCLKYARPLEYITLLRNGVEITQQDQNDILWCELFGIQENGVYRSWYTAEVAQAPLSSFYGNTSDQTSSSVSGIIRASVLLDPNGYQASFLRLWEAIYNNVEYGRMDAYQGNGRTIV